MSHRDGDTSRSERDLREAFAAKAGQAPSAEDVLAAVRAATRGRTPRPRRTSWRLIAGAAVVAAVITVPVTLIARQGSDQPTSGSAGSAGRAAQPGPPAAGGGAAGGMDAPVTSAGAAAAGSAGGKSAPVNDTEQRSVTAPALPSTPGRGGGSRPSAGPATCTVAQMSFTLAWRRDGAALTGTLTATNHATAPCRPPAPRLAPLGPDGQPLAVVNLVPPHPAETVVAAGRTVGSAVHWAGWCGAAPSATVHIQWGPAGAEVHASGPTGPACGPDQTLQVVGFVPHP